MTRPERPVGEDDLHAYVDNQLEAARRPAVERHLEADADAAQRVAAYKAQRQALRAAFAAQAAEPLPPRLSLTQIIEARQRRWTPWRMAASVVLALGVGGVCGWFLHSQPMQNRTALAMALLEQEALTSHVVYAPDRRHPIEVAGAEEAQLRQWLSRRLNRTVAPPDLAAFGYRLIGGRLLATEHGGAAALFMYDDAHGNRLSLLLRPMAPQLRAPQTDMRQAKLNGYAWIEKGMGYALVGPVPDSELDRVAGQIRAELGA